MLPGTGGAIVPNWGVGAASPTGRGKSPISHLPPPSWATVGAFGAPSPQPLAPVTVTVSRSVGRWWVGNGDTGGEGDAGRRRTGQDVLLLPTVPSAETGEASRPQ